MLPLAIAFFALVSPSAAAEGAIPTCTAEPGSTACTAPEHEEGALLQLGARGGSSSALLPEASPTLETIQQMALLGGQSREREAGGQKKKDDKCATTTYEAKMILPKNAKAAGIEPPMVVATEANMDPKLKTLGLDFTGLWWMRGNPVPEEVVSLANSVVNASTYPALLEMPNNRAGMWAWVDDPIGWILQKYYSAYEAEAPTDVVFESTIYGKISTGLTEIPLIWVDQFPFIYIDEDQWLRPSIFQNRSVIADTNYTLTRIVMGDGSPHPTYWPLFMDHMASKSWFGKSEPGAKKMISMSSDDGCQRRCQILFPCSFCQLFC